MDTLIVERRLRPIYESLELGNHKKALQETEKVLKKSPSLQCAVALKALSLYRMGRDEESEIIINKLLEEQPCGEATLQVMSFYYREKDQLHKVCDLYNNAVKKAPGNEELLAHLFMSYVRILDFHSQQTIALQIYKLSSKTTYYLWAVVSIVLKASRGSESQNLERLNVLLTLAQKMMDKLIAENRLEGEQDVQLYLNILKLRERYQEALDFLESTLGKNLYPSAPVSLKIYFMKMLNKWSDVNILLKKLLLEDRDRWDFYKEYINSVFELEKLNDSTSGADFNFELCHNFLCQLIEIDANQVRGPYLGRLELHCQMVNNNFNASELLGDFLELLVEYFRLFGNKPCCAKDIILFLEYLEPSRRAGFASRLLQVCEINSTSLPQNKEQMQKHICSLQVSRICGAHALSVEHLSALYTALSLHYEHGLSAFAGDLLPTDLVPSDHYALLAVHVMYDLALKLKSSDRLIEALYLLHYLLTNSPSNFHAKLLCLQLYHIIGCGLGAHKTYENLDIKHVQLDSLGYLHCSQLPVVGIPSIAKPVYDATLKFFTTSYKDSIEYMIMCYKFDSYSKLNEFMEFRDKISNSFHYTHIAAEALLLEIVCFSGASYQSNICSFKSMSIGCKDDKIQWDKLHDNRDLTVVIRWDPSSKIDEIESLTTDTISNNKINSMNCIKNETFSQNVEMLQIRSTLLRIVGACVDVYIRRNDFNNDNTSYETLKMLQTEWRNLFLKIRKSDHKKVSNHFLVNLLPIRLFGMLSIPYEEVFKNVVQFILDLEKDDEIPKITFLLDNITEVSDLFIEAINSHNKQDDLLWNRRNILETLVNSIEILSLLAFIFSVSNEYYTQIVNVKPNKKNKKKPKNNTHIKLPDAESTNELTNYIGSCSVKQRLEILSSIILKLKNKFQLCDEALDGWKTPNVAPNLTDNLLSMPLNSKVEELVNSTIKDNHSITVKELKSIIKEKIRMLK